MRTIEFRGLTKYTKEWVFGDLIHGVGAKEGRMYILPRIINVAYVKTKAKPHEIDGYEIDPETVGQFTGLHDKNGVKIFEGDFVSADLQRHFAQIIYKNGCFMFELFDGNLYHDIFYPTDALDKTEYPYGEVIGNIHEGGNP